MLEEYYIKHDDVERAISELQKFAERIFLFDPVTCENEISKDIYYSDIYRVNDCINLLQHYDDLLTVIRKEDVK